MVACKVEFLVVRNLFGVLAAGMLREGLGVLV